MQWCPAPAWPRPARIAPLPLLRSPVPPDGLLLVMHEQLVGEVGVVAVKPEVVKRGRRICWPTDQATQRNGIYPHVNGLSTDRSAYAYRHSRSCKGQQTVADGQPTNGK